MKTIFIYTNIYSHYREAMWNHLMNSERAEFHFAFGEDKNSNILQKWDEDNNRLHRLKNVYFRKKILIWQIGLISLYLQNWNHLNIFLGDAYNLATWVCLVIGKVFGKQTVLWGHGIYGKENTLQLGFRKAFFSLASKHLVYSNFGKEQMIKNGFNHEDIHVIYNSLNYDESVKCKIQALKLRKKDVYPFYKDISAPVIIFIGRLTKVKKLNLLIEVINLLQKQEFNCNLFILGDGTEKDNLKELARTKLEAETYYFYGSCYDETKIAEFITHADLCVSPGNVGLTAMHCLSYGTPVATHSNFSNQMPEFESIQPGRSGFFFEEDQPESIRQGITEWFKINGHKRQEIRDNCYEIIDSRYNYYNQEKILLKLIDHPKDQK